MNSQYQKLVKMHCSFQLIKIGQKIRLNKQQLLFTNFEN